MTKRCLLLMIAFVVLTWSAASSPQESANHCLVNAKNDQEQRTYYSSTNDSNSTTTTFCSEKSIYQNNCDKPIFALFRLSNDNPPSASRMSGFVNDLYLYPNIAIAIEHDLNREQFSHICEDDYSVVYCSEFVGYPLPPAEILAEPVENAEAHQIRREESDKHYEEHFKQLATSNCYRAITADELSFESTPNFNSSNFASLEYYYILRPFEGKMRGTYISFSIDGSLSNPLTELWEKAPRQPHSGENILNLH